MSTVPHARFPRPPMGDGGPSSAIDRPSSYLCDMPILILTLLIIISQPRIACCRALRRGGSPHSEMKNAHEESAVSQISFVSGFGFFEVQITARKRRFQAEKISAPFSKLVCIRGCSNFPVFHLKLLLWVASFYRSTAV